MKYSPSLFAIQWNIFFYTKIIFCWQIFYFFQLDLNLTPTYRGTRVRNFSFLNFVCCSPVFLLVVPPRLQPTSLLQRPQPLTFLLSNRVSLQSTTVRGTRGSYFVRTWRMFTEEFLSSGPTHISIRTPSLSSPLIRPSISSRLMSGGCHLCLLTGQPPRPSNTVRRGPSPCLRICSGHYKHIWHRIYYGNTHNIIFS